MLKTIIPACLMLAAAAPAGASCTQADIAGTWTAYSLTQDSGQLAWTACNLVISTAGTFGTASSTCTASGQTVKVQGSIKLTAAAKCAYGGSISAPAIGQSDPIPSVTLSLDKQTAFGVTGTNAAGNVSGISMVKTK